MKKALLVLLLLAFVAGGLFAQFSFSGAVNAGVGLLKQDGRGTHFGLIRHDYGGEGIRGRLNVKAANEEGTAGLFIRLQATGKTLNPVSLPAAYGWLKFIDNVIEVQGGLINGTNYDTLDVISDGASLYANDFNFGLLTYIQPIDILSFGLGVKTGNVLSDEESIKASNAALWVGFGLTLDALDFVAQSSFTHGKGDALASIGVNAIENVTLAFTVALNDLNAFSDRGEMHFYEQFGFDGVENLSLNLAAHQAITKDASTAKDLYFRLWFWATYAIGNIVPRLDVNFVMGGTCQEPNSFYGPEMFAPSYYKEDKYLSFSPSVQFQVSGSQYIEFGYVGIKGLGDKNKFTDDGFHHGLFINLFTSF